MFQFFQYTNRPLPHLLFENCEYQSHAFPTELSWQVLIGGSLTVLLFVHQLAFGLKRI